MRSCLHEESVVDTLLARDPDLVSRLPADELRRLPDAAQENKADVVSRLLAAGWPVDARGQHGGTALHWAAFHGTPEIARIILPYRPDLELRDRDFGAPPLGWATHGSLDGWHASTGDYAGVVEVLLAAGARLPAASAVDATEPVLAVLRRHGFGQERR
ncbi:MAG: ankyrin repeat domain-containing protein [Gemmatimonadaceae bacterium]